MTPQREKQTIHCMKNNIFEKKTWRKYNVNITIFDSFRNKSIEQDNDKN